MPAKIEPQLMKALESSAAADALIEVVVSFETDGVHETAASMPLMKRREVRASAVSQLIEHALAQAGKLTGTQPAEVTPFPLTGSAYVRAPCSYLRALVHQPEVAGAMLNSGS
jgi:hypothetical protein